MLVKDIIKLVCSFIGEREILKKLNVQVSNPEFTEREQEKVDLLVRCFNLVNQEIASEYIPFVRKEKVVCKNGIIKFFDLRYDVINVLKVKNKFGLDLKFVTYPSYVEVEGNGTTIIYNGWPDPLTINQVVEDIPGLSDRIYAYGIASEFLLIDGLSEDAEIWEDRYKQALFIASKKKGEHILPKRKWL